jgi:hypothetical protein
MEAMPLMVHTASATGSSSEARTALQARLQARRGEIEQAVLNRIFAVADPAKGTEPEYVAGVRATVAIAIDYGIAAVQLGEQRSATPPPELLAQARLAARNGVNLDTVLRRYFAGYALVADYLVEEAERSATLSSSELQGLLRSQAALLERIVAAVSEEHTRESTARVATAEARRAERVERLLAGELVDPTELAYDFEAHHVGVIASGPGAGQAVRELASISDRRLLMVRREGEVLWAWFGGCRALDPADLRHHAATVFPPEVAMAIGEAAVGLVGWRLTHQQARAALPIALRGSEPLVRYGDVALLAAVLRDPILATSLQELYLAPLEGERHGGEVLRETMRAYFTAQGNISSAAHLLGVKRQTVANRLRAIEERLGRDLTTCAAEMDAALRLEELNTAHPIPFGRTRAETSFEGPGPLAKEVVA